MMIKILGRLPFTKRLETDMVIDMCDCFRFLGFLFQVVNAECRYDCLGFNAFFRIILAKVQSNNYGIFLNVVV